MMEPSAGVNLCGSFPLLYRYHHVHCYPKLNAKRWKRKIEIQIATMIKNLREGFKKTYWGKVWSFAKPGGVSEGDEKPNCFFEKSIFQRVSRIILGPPKHVLHLVWSAYFISTAVRTALKVARTPQILGERRQL